MTNRLDDDCTALEGRPLQGNHIRSSCLNLLGGSALTDPVHLLKPGARVWRPGYYQMLDRRRRPIGAPFKFHAGSRLAPTPERGCSWLRLGGDGADELTLF